jgi:hypothetical protein
MNGKIRAKISSFACAFVVAVCAVHESAHARVDVYVRVDGCSGDHYPRIVCDVAVRDASGRSIDHLDPRAFGVEFDELSVVSPKVTLVEAEAERSEVIVLLDDGLVNRGRYARDWRRAADVILSDMPLGKSVVVLNASQAYAAAAPLPYSTVEDIERIRARVREHKLTPHARLHDALCDAASQAPRSARPVVWLAVVSDGLDRGSVVCDLDAAVQAVERARAPVLVIGVGPYAGELRRVAAASNGLYVDVEDVSGMASALHEVQQRARQRYRVEFAVAHPADGREHTVTVSVRGGAHDSVPIDALPLAPTLLGLELSSDGLAAAPERLPLHGRVRVEPRFIGRGASVAEFVLDGMHTRVDVPPYAFEFDGGKLPQDRPTVLSVTVYGASGEVSAESITAIRIAPDGSAAAYQIDPTNAGVRAWVAGSVGSLAAGSASAVLLGAVGAALLRRWHGSSKTLRAAPESSLRAHATRDACDATTIAPRIERVGGADSARALLLQIRTPDEKVRSIRLCAAGVLGRRGDGVDNEIAVESRFVSLRHVRFSPVSAGWQVEDLHSVNGVRHNGRALEPGAAAALNPGDRVACADVVVDVVAIGS